jgi:uncharacterized membrane protein
MARLLIAYVAALVPFFALDFVWLGLMGPRLYKPALGDMVAAAPRLGPAVTFYLLYIAGTVFFAVKPALGGASWRIALINGAALGVFAYATYDLTNQATLRIWPMRITIFDIAWGGFATALAATVSFSVTAWSAQAAR